MMIAQCINRLLLATVLFLCVSNASAGPNTQDFRSVVGYWTTVDDNTGKVRSIIRIWENHGVIYGRIEKVFKQPGDTGICSLCPGQFRNKPILGLTILWGLEKTGQNVWSGGEILDPKKGNIYRLILTLENQGRLIRARGYVGFSLFGRTQNWYRRF